MSKIASRAFLLCLAVLVGWSIYWYVIAPGSPLDWDEAAHALRGLLIAHDLEQGDLPSFLYDTYRQVYWPPGHSWLVGIAFLVGGISTVTARIVSVFAFVAAALALYLASLRMDDRSGELAAIIAATLFLTSPGLVASAGRCMLEIPALLCLILTFLAYFRLDHRTSGPWAYLLLGLGITVTYLCKSNYGILVGGAVFLALLLDFRFRPSRSLVRAGFFTALPLLVAFPVWFAYPPKLSSTWYALVNQPHGIKATYSLDGLLFYPRSLFEMSGSPLVAGLLLASFFAALGFMDNKNVRLLVILVTTQLLIGQVHHTKVQRHLLPVMPALFLLTGFVLEKGWQWAGQRPRKFTRLFLVFLGLAALASSILPFTRSLAPLERTHDPEIVTHIADAARLGRTLVVGSMDISDPHPPGLDWQLSMEQGVMAVTGSGAIMDWEGRERLTAAMGDIPALEGLERLLLPVIDRGRENDLRSLYLGLPPGTTYSRSSEGFRRFLEQMADEHALERIVVVTSYEADADYPMGFVEAGLEEGGWYCGAARRFAGSHVEVRICGRGLD